MNGNGWAHAEKADCYDRRGATARHVYVLACLSVVSNYESYIVAMCVVVGATNSILYVYTI